MKGKWIGAATLWVLFSLLLSPSEGGIQAQQQPPAGEWQTYVDSRYGYRVGYPPDWRARPAFDNAPGEPYLIRRRVTLEHEAGARIDVDVWEKAPELSMLGWFEAVESITSTLDANAVVGGQAAFVHVDPGSCGSPMVFATYVPFGTRVFKIHHQSTGNVAFLDVYSAVLRSFELTGVDSPIPDRLPDLASMVPETCGTNICPSTCWGGCTFALRSDGCCGYHAVPRWQCSRECLGSVVGDFLGNCTWWGAYTRRDVGALASGDAGNWAISVRNTGQLPVDTTPKVGDTVVHPGSSYNHVAYVVWVSDTGASYRVSDMGWCSDCLPSIEETKRYYADSDNEFIHCAGDPEIPTTDWTFTNCPFGWTPSNGFTASTLDGSAWVLNPGLEPYLLSPVLAVDAGDYTRIVVRMRSSAADTAGKIYFTTAASPEFDEAKSAGFTVVNDGEWRDVVVEMGTNSLWQGTVTRVRLHPVITGNGDGSEDSVGVGRIEFDNADTTDPTAPANLHPADPAGWYGIYTRLQRPTFAWDASSDGGSGVKGYYAAIDQGEPNGSGVNDVWLGDTTSWRVTTGLGDRAHFLRVKAEDNAGNSSLSAKYHFVVDTTPPANPITVDAGCAARNNRWQNECYDPAFTWSGADDGDGSGVAGYHYYWGDLASGVPDTYTTMAAFDPGPVTSPGGCATHFFNLATRDNLLHEGVAGPAFVLRYDGETPSGARLEIDGGAATTNQLRVQLDIRGDDPCSGLRDMRLSNDGIEWTRWLSYAQGVSWQLPALDGQTLPVYLQLRDAAGNESAVVSDTVSLDLYPEKPHSANYRIWGDVIDTAGAASSPMTYTLLSAVGQPWVGDGLASASYQLRSGFLAARSAYTVPQPVAAGWPAVDTTDGDREQRELSGIPVSELALPPGRAAVDVARSGDGHFGLRAGDLGLDYTNQITTLLTISAPGVDQLQLSSTPGYLTATWQSYVPTVTWYYAPDPGIITGTRIYARFRDADGTVYGEYETTVFYDTVPPIGSVKVLSASLGLATLWLDASDDNSGVYDVRLGEDRALNGAAWRFYTETLTTTWPEEGVLYVQYRDRAGNLSRVVATKEHVYLPLVVK